MLKFKWNSIKKMTVFAVNSYIILCRKLPSKLLGNCRPVNCISLPVRYILEYFWIHMWMILHMMSFRLCSVVIFVMFEALCTMYLFFFNGFLPVLFFQSCLKFVRMMKQCPSWSLNFPCAVADSRGHGVHREEELYSQRPESS